MEAPAGNPIRDHIFGEVRNVARQYIWLLALHRGSSGDALLKLSRSLGGEPEPLSNARAWRLTIEIIMGKVDHELSVEGACRAAFARLATGMRWASIAEGLHRNPQRTKEVVDRAVGSLYAEFVSRGITERYRGDDSTPDGMAQCRDCGTWVASGRKHSPADCTEMQVINERCAAASVGSACAMSEAVAAA